MLKRSLCCALLLLAAGRSLANAGSEPFSEWSDYLAVLSKSDQRVLSSLERNDQHTRQHVYELFLKSLASGVMSGWSDPDYPDFVPLVSNVLNTVGVNPDFIYGYSKIDGRGVYRLSGFRGEGLFLQFDLMAGGLGVLDQLGPSVGSIDIDTLNLGPKGEFNLVLSTERPAGYTGDWYPMAATTKTINMRQASYYWGRDVTARIAIERLDQPHDPQLPSAELIATRIEALMAYPAFYAQFALQHIKHLRDKGFVNKLEHDDWAGRGGVQGQHYYQGLFELKPGHVLVLETALPDTVRYWNVQLSDNYWNSIDWMNHQASLNGGQAVIDSDGRFRAVIASEDPGVANWLDTAGLSQGSLMLRWTGASSGPAPTLTSVALSELADYLPKTTHWLTAEERQLRLRDRRRSVQLRRRW